MSILWKGSVIILAETHRRVIRRVNQEIKNEYGINLNIDKLTWGSVAPDVLPYYRMIRHYKDESIKYISKEIVLLIHLFRYSKLENLNKIQNNYFSRKLGIISHYLCDYTCYPHAYRKTYMGNMREHMKYESDLNKYSAKHEFELFSFKNLNVNSEDNLVKYVEEYIESIVKEYMLNQPNFSNDLNFGFLLS
ncbi:zinc dependent phospholipase C family protein [Peptoniphilus asaccharolyticus]|uniref:zinc dependent phospholipase C family protein n=1 Tax=Peptoniphilus asaccharolyticus TaxID=1258 RepID=UPI00117C520C|nr:zinc dependent phospholipase C family protein [Peptoniphilus asaccharolyticus]MBL7575143.1 zinc dependent phospholipase C family protein [Peptoniphilus asaccharolyticus]